MTTQTTSATNLSAPASPIAKQRLKLFKAMPAALQDVATDFEKRWSRASQGVIMINYDMGTRITNIIGDESTYGTGAVKQLAEYLQFSENALYSLQNFAEAFGRDFVKEQSARLMENGGVLEQGHWYHLMKVKEPVELDKIMERVFKQSLSVNDLEKEIRSGGAGGTKNSRQGGRKPKTPTSAIAGLQQTYTMALKIHNFGNVANKSVFDAIDAMEPDKISDALLTKLQVTRETLAHTYDTSEQMIKRLDKNIARVLKVIEQKKVQEAKDAEAKEAEAAKEVEGGDTPVGKNGAAKAKKKKNKAKARATATA